jgi:hypothetical protein
LKNTTHAVIGGTTPTASEDPGEFRNGQRGDSQHARNGSARRDGRPSGNPNDSTDYEERSGVGQGQIMGALASPTERAMNVSLIQGTSTAFLDAYVKQDAIALEWLRKNASRWIGTHGELRKK